MENYKNTVKQILESEPIIESGIKLVNIGAEKMVFETPGSDRKVIKMDTNYIRSKISFLLSKELFKHEAIDDIDDELKEKIKERKTVEDEITEVFGKEHILRNGIFKLKIPLNKEAIIKILGDTYKQYYSQIDNSAIYELEVIAEIQLKANELGDREAFKTWSFSTDLITDDNFRNTNDIPEALSLIRKSIDGNFIAEFETEINKNEEFKQTVIEILGKIIKYVKRTGLMLDIFGPDNLTIFKDKDGKLDYHLLDVVLPGRQEHWSENISNDKQLNLLRHAYTFFYSINSLANKVGITENLEPEDLTYFKNNGIPSEGKIPSRKAVN